MACAGLAWNSPPVVLSAAGRARSWRTPPLGTRAPRAHHRVQPTTQPAELMMNANLKRLISPAMIVACVALLVALGGVSYAAGVLPANSVGSSRSRSER